MYVPLSRSVTALIFSPRSLEEIVTVSTGTPAPVASVIVTVTVLVEVPLATIDDGWRARLMAVACAVACEVWVRGAVAVSPAAASVAVIVT